MTEPSPTPLAEPGPTTRLCFAGVAFDVTPAPSAGWALDDEHRNASATFDASPVVGLVRCAVAAADVPCGEREVRWAWDGDLASVSTSRVRGEVRRLRPGHYAASMLVAPGAAGSSSALTALAALIVQREGGLVLHAAGVELEGRAVLFIGPSGAGKTTASHLCPGARWLCRDRAAVYPTSRGWWVAPMCGGDAIDLPRSSAASLPVGAILRVRRDGTTAISRTERWAALRDLRESIQSGDAGGGQLELDAALRLIDEAPLGRASTVLGEPLTPALRAWLAEHAS
ncbi:MAG: hypothetical protein IT378_19510 [Sandaracinaceae bacterium]|nr:hypothetical protein [Sandaracinaceae bacterium]